MKVDLPAPFGPVSPYRRPLENVVVTSSKSTFDPYRMEMPWTEIMIVCSAGRLRLKGTIHCSAEVRYISHFSRQFVRFQERAMRRHFRGLVLAAGTAALVARLPLGAAGETIDYDGIAKSKEQGLAAQNSKVIEISSWLTDVLGPRLTGSPNTQKAGEWTVAKMQEWGLQNVSLEPWTDRGRIPRGWTNDKFYMAAVAPQAFPIAGTPVAWTPGTGGLVRGDVMLVTGTNQEDLQKYKGALRGKWILTQPAPDVPALWAAPATRRTTEELEQLALATQPRTEFGVISPVAPLSGRFSATGRGQTLSAAASRTEFFRTEGALGTLSTTTRGHGIYVIGGRADSDPDKTLPSIVIPAEHYGRLARIIANGLPVTLEAEIKNTY